MNPLLPWLEERNDSAQLAHVGRVVDKDDLVSEERSWQEAIQQFSPVQLQKEKWTINFSASFCPLSSWGNAVKADNDCQPLTETKKEKKCLLTALLMMTLTNRNDVSSSSKVYSLKTALAIRSCFIFFSLGMAFSKAVRKPRISSTSACFLLSELTSKMPMDSATLTRELVLCAFRAFWKVSSYGHKPRSGWKQKKSWRLLPCKSALNFQSRAESQKEKRQ